MNDAMVEYEHRAWAHNIDIFTRYSDRYATACEQLNDAKMDAIKFADVNPLFWEKLIIIRTENCNWYYSHMQRIADKYPNHIKMPTKNH